MNIYRKIAIILVMIIVVAACLSLLSCTSTRREEPPVVPVVATERDRTIKRASEAYDEGRRLYSVAEYHGAAKSFSISAGIFPTKLAWLYIAACYIKVGAYEKANLAAVTGLSITTESFGVPDRELAKQVDEELFASWLESAEKMIKHPTTPM
jgi:hypothetical protein